MTALSPLSGIKRGKIKRPRRCTMYGVHGVGKSTWAAGAPSPIVVAVEDGADDVDVPKFPVARSLDQVRANLQALRVEAHDYKTVVLDTLDWLERLIWDEVCVAAGVRSIEDIGYQKGYVFALNQWREILALFDALRDERGMTIVLLAHAAAVKFKTPEDEAFERYAPRLHKAAAAVVQEWCDEVFFATYSALSDPKRVKTETPERIMRTSEGPAHVAKNRLKMPPEIELDWRAYQYFIDLAGAEPAAPPAPAST